MNDIAYKCAFMGYEGKYWGGVFILNVAPGLGQGIAKKSFFEKMLDFCVN